ncbi:hypothetical protein F1737_02495 [Methanoplanus sp. FWC-SCC4]|uniref:KEOPS complex Pcc1-like subunit n=1 Tax=Methanochimaera problematica TaxID=2609417 RepID=A0AA97FCD6_9EURY|nr:KEOPS complex subunit Pcc1 [Methanoplanus sp. FWC-SCC4]WOF15634.1 hypothetical protein F1737_02495 [Methanoplanus sp. FWC-SCC4]
MSLISGKITTYHRNAECVAKAIASDNLKSMQTNSKGNTVITEIKGNKLRSIIASVDDYLMNLSISEDVCSYISEK